MREAASTADARNWAVRLRAIGSLESNLRIASDALSGARSGRRQTPRRRLPSSPLFHVWTFRAGKVIRLHALRDPDKARVLAGLVNQPTLR